MLHHFFLALVLLGLFLAHILLDRRRLRLPPGPPRRLLVGNVGDLPSSREWRTYEKWAEQYGDLVYLNVLGTSLLFVNSNDLARELFEKRSKIYSDRPTLIMLNELMGFDWGVPFMPYGDWWRRHRQIIQRKMSSNFLATCHPIQLKHTQQLLARLNASPLKFVEHARHAITAIILEITYGIEIESQNDPYVNLIEDALGAAAQATAPGTFLVDMLPALKYLPEWVPGASFQRKARIWRKSIIDMAEVPFQVVKTMMANGKAKPSLTSSLLEDLSAMDARARLSQDEETIIRNVAGMVYGGGGDTTTCALEIFFLAMVLYPEAQRKAQKELDDVVGPHTLPTFIDRDRLRYTHALCKEVLRWHPVAPLALPHRLIKDDVIGNYFIPKGTLVFGNSWQILHSEKLFGHDTHIFRPERFLEDPNREPNVAFGFGRRICPGRPLAEDSLFIVIASILHMFSLSPSKECTPSMDAFVSGSIS
ncbi:cytochrome P450 [Hysterangium stoloniferum]|nr:cytochrome P450 [Hysterangium stoloniferum]